MKNKKETKMPSHPLIGEILLELDLISEQELEEALAIQKTNNKLLGQILIALGYCSPEIVISALDMQGVSIFDKPMET